MNKIRHTELKTEYVEDGTVLSLTEWVEKDGIRYFTHTFTEPAARGRGLATSVIEAGIAKAVEDKVEIVAVCPAVIAWLEDRDIAWRKATDEELTWLSRHEA